MSLREVELQQTLDRRNLQIINQDAEIAKLRDALRAAATELATTINTINNDLKSSICSTDLDDPDYLDFQTVHEAMECLA